jgi:hypothetical protein
MSLQGPLIVVADCPAAGLSAALAVKPAALVIAEPGRPTNETSSRMLCLQIATAAGPIVPVVSVTEPAGEPALPIALTASHHHDRVVARLQSALRVRALHATVLRRCDAFSGAPPQFPAGDALDDATVLVAGRGPLYPALSTAMGERVKMVGALSVETAAKHLEAREIDGIIVGDGFSPKLIEAFIELLGQDARNRDLPVSVIGRFGGCALSNVDEVDSDPETIVAHAAAGTPARLRSAIETHAQLARHRRAARR